ncbi:MAG: DUF1049 domain-containing protein [Candidatus Atribacteria bacterium]|nr:MAG: DUF1049 domain-containing protein [Candidatus Atribacteria bacterium]
MRARSVVIIVLAILSLTLVAQNTQVLSFKLWFWSLQSVPITSLLAGSLVVGLLIGVLLGRPWKKKKAAPRQVPPSPTPKKKPTTPKEPI